MLFHEGVYYWYGENKEGRTWLPESTKSWDGYRVDVTGIRCYSSKDLLHWQDRGLVLKAVPDDPSHDLHPSKVCERPKVVFNPRTKKFVMWMHIDSEDYRAARAGVAVADRPTGPFTYLESMPPEGQDSQDQTVFQDDDGKVYRIYSSEKDDTTYISLLTDDYLKHTGKFVRVFVKRRMEAQAVFKHAEKYWLIASDCTGWDPNPARSAVADSIWGPWTELGNPCRGPEAARTFRGQSTFVFPVVGKKNSFIFMADRWNKTNLPDSRYLWLPLQFRDNKPVVEWRPSWDLTFFQQESEPPKPTKPSNISLLISGRLAAQAEPQPMTLVAPQPASRSGFKLGQARRPDGAGLDVDSYSLRRNGHRWLPAMGEFQYSRYPAKEWRGELLKMKAGGLDIVATYVFWIHHEEVEGRFDWSGQRSLRRFIELCREVGLLAVVRCGPYCHGEARRGGFPDWLQEKGWKLHSDDPNYLARVRTLYGEIGRQLQGLLWKDGGPVIGIQVENEYEGPAEHLLTLKRLAREAGIDVPFYTRTGWPDLTTPMPFGELLPVYGRYAEGFWDRELTPMPGWYWAAFIFSHLRTDGTIATDLFGVRTARDTPDAVRYPFLCCETGGGMASSYHRRILIDTADVEAVALGQLGSGSTMLGYYVYHGGTNPDGKRSTLHESQAIGDYNDLPFKSYDFQAPLREYGQLSPHYHSLRRLHLFLHEWGPALAGMPMTLPEQKPADRDDVKTLRWCVRSDGQSGFVFVNNYQRLQKRLAMPDVQFALRLPSETLTFPDSPVTIPADSRFFWPFNLDLGHDVRLAWATAQPVCAIDEGHRRTVFFAQTPGIAAQFAFAGDAKIKASRQISRRRDYAIVENVAAGRETAFQISGRDGGVRIVLLDQADSLSLWKGAWQGRERVFLSSAGLTLDGEILSLTSTDRSELAVGVYPAPSQVRSAGTWVPSGAMGSSRASRWWRQWTLRDQSSSNKSSPPVPRETFTWGRE